MGTRRGEGEESRGSWRTTAQDGTHTHAHTHRHTHTDTHTHTHTRKLPGATDKTDPQCPLLNAFVDRRAAMAAETDSQSTCASQTPSAGELFASP